jgi:hypothetical protein
MANPRPLELSNAALLKPLKYRYFGTEFLKIVQILALKMTIFKKFGPLAYLGWPWLY